MNGLGALPEHEDFIELVEGLSSPKILGLVLGLVAHIVEIRR